MKKLKTIAFIDAANIIYGAKDEAGFKVDLKRLAKYLISRFEVMEIYFYGGVNTKKINYEHYEKKLKKFGFIPRLKETKLYFQKPKILSFICKFCHKENEIQQKPKGRIKANCDVDLTIDVLENMNRFNRFIFLSGDGDFEPLLKKAKNLKREVYIIASARRTARSLRKLAAEKFIEIERLKDFIAIKKGGDTF